MAGRSNLISYKSFIGNRLKWAITLSYFKIRISSHCGFGSSKVQWPQKRRYCVQDVSSLQTEVYYDPVAWLVGRFLRDVFRVDKRLVLPLKAYGSLAFLVAFSPSLAATSDVSNNIRVRLINLESLWYTPWWEVRMSSALWKSTLASAAASFVPLAWRSLPSH